MHIRDFSQKYSAYSTEVLKNTLKWLETEIVDIEMNMTVNDDVNLKERWTEKKKHLGLILDERVKGALIRSHYSSMKDMDAPTFFFNLEHKVGQQKLMLSLKDNNGHVTSDPQEMRKIAVDFYSNLYATEISDEQCRKELLNDLPVLSEDHKELLETDISFEEVSLAVKSLSSRKNPGLDRLPAEFYKSFWTIIGDDYFEVLQKCCIEGNLPTSCQRAVLSLLPKKGDLTFLKNWRPVAILCTEYTILSKVIANKLNNVLYEIVHKDQSYCIKNRSIMDNLHLIRDVVDYAYGKDVSMGLLSLDQEKAFDRVDHVFLFDTLNDFGFGEKFISRIKLLYTGATCMIKMGGGLSIPINVKRGIRQGCPLSGQLYSIVIEPLLCKLRRELMGLQINTLNCSIKLSAYADDVTVIIRDQSDIQVLKQALEFYGKASSAVVNWGKSDALWCGFKGPKLPGGSQWRSVGFKYLGVFLGTEGFKKKNWEGLLEKVCAKLSR